MTRIEGWNVYPIDQYNSTQTIINQEISQEQDFNNHSISINRYMWSDGWSAAQISQIVDVSPNEVYDLRALAKGGIWSDNGPQGSIRLYDMQNADNKVVIPVTSTDFEEYTGSISTLANTKQVKVELYLERTKWGASCSALVVDDVVLNGRSRTLDQKVGFLNEFAEVDYFTYDDTGAYAPSFVSLDVDDIDYMTDIESPEDNSNTLSGYVSEGHLYLNNVSEGSIVRLYTLEGKPVFLTRQYTVGMQIPLGAPGIYLCVVTDAHGERVVKVRY